MPPEYREFWRHVGDGESLIRYLQSAVGEVVGKAGFEHAASGPEPGLYQAELLPDDSVFGSLRGLGAAASSWIVESPPYRRPIAVPGTVESNDRVTISLLNIDVCTLRIRRRPRISGRSIETGVV